MGWRVVIVTRVLPVVLGLDATLREAGHEPVALLTVRDAQGRYGDFDLGGMLNEVPADLDVLMPAGRQGIAPLLESVQPDLVACIGFPWKIPPEALAVPRLGWLNGHPSLLPHHRGPVPVAWAIRLGEPEIGITFHRVDVEPDAFYPRLGPYMVDAFQESIAKLAAGDEGVPQTGGGEYETFFTDEDARLDLARPRAEVH